MRLYGSIPVTVLQALKADHQSRQAVIKQEISEASATEEKLRNEQKSYFARFDNHLDQPQNGPYWLDIPQVAQVISEAIHYRHDRIYQLIAYCIMSNHVHLILNTEARDDLKSLYRILQSLKLHTARKSNQLLQRQGAFWQPESYDHVVRSSKELVRVIRYVLQNPVKAGLVDHWQAWPYSYVNEDFL